MRAFPAKRVHTWKSSHLFGQVCRIQIIKQRQCQLYYTHKRLSAKSHFASKKYLIFCWPRWHVSSFVVQANASPPPSLFLPSVQQPEAASCMLSPLPPANQSNWQLLEMCACLYSPAQARDGRALEFRPRLILNQRCQMAAHHFGVGIRELSCTSLGRNCFVFFPTENECWRTVRDGAITENCISVIALNVIRTDS